MVITPEDTASPFAAYLQKLADAEAAALVAGPVSAPLQLAYKKLLESKAPAIEQDSALLAQLQQYAGIS